MMSKRSEQTQKMMLLAMNPLNERITELEEEKETLKRLVDEYKPHVDGAWEQVKLKTGRIDDLDEENTELLEALEAVLSNYSPVSGYYVTSDDAMRAFDAIDKARGE